MILILVSIFFVFLAAACNSTIDTLDHHQSSSIFSTFKNGLWWNFHEGWRNKYIDRDPKKGRVKLFWKINKPVQITDAWHFFKMLMIVFMCTASVFAAASVYMSENHEWYSYIILLIVYGLTWNLTFSLFYERILIKNK